MNYNVFLFTHLLAAYNRLPEWCTYDMLYDKFADIWYTEFINSEFNKLSKSELISNKTNFKENYEKKLIQKLKYLYGIWVF